VNDVRAICFVMTDRACVRANGVEILDNRLALIGLALAAQVHKSPSRLHFPRDCRLVA
jgi:hypothetical protein